MITTQSTSTLRSRRKKKTFKIFTTVSSILTVPLKNGQNQASRLVIVFSPNWIYFIYIFDSKTGGVSRSMVLSFSLTVHGYLVCIYITVFGLFSGRYWYFGWFLTLFFSGLLYSIWFIQLFSFIDVIIILTRLLPCLVFVCLIVLMSVLLV